MSSDMKLICTITDEDVGEKNLKMENPKLRLGARGIVKRDDSKIALFYKSNKNEYKLPGGGIEGYEKPEIAFKREVLEETGCEVEIVKKLGITEEYKSLNNFKQISYVFVGRVENETHILNLTEKEKEEGAKLLWKTPEEALELINGCYSNLIGSKYDSVYSTKFIILRDSKILKRYIREEIYETAILNARITMYHQTMKNKAPSWLLTCLAQEVGAELAEEFGVDKDIVLLTLYLQHLVFDQITS